jgi:hypothetical protein
MGSRPFIYVDAGPLSRLQVLSIGLSCPYNSTAREIKGLGLGGLLLFVG